MCFDIWYYEQQTDIGYREMKKAFEAGQQSKQAEVDALKVKIDGVLKLMRQPMRGTTSDLLSDIEDILG